MFLKISKFESVKRQLDTAILLYFYDGDPVSIHTLAGAAHRILHDLNKHLKGSRMILDLEFETDGARKIYFENLNKAKNHFKHAENDPKSVVEFNPNLNDFFIYDTCKKYSDLISEINPAFDVFMAWFVFKYDGKNF